MAWPLKKCGSSNTVLPVTLLQLHRFEKKIDGRLALISLVPTWPPRSCDFFLWGFIKSLVYGNDPRILLDFKQEIQRCNVSCNFKHKHYVTTRCYVNIRRSPTMDRDFWSEHHGFCFWIWIYIKKMILHNNILPAWRPSPSR